MQPAETYRFGPFIVDTARMALIEGGRELELRPKAFNVLLRLLENSGRVVTKDELVEAVWPNVIVNDDALAQCVRDIRKAIGDTEQRYIRTQARRGYIFVHPVIVSGPSAGPAYRSLAVLPFDADDAVDSYLAEGLAEATINSLAKLSGLRVAPRPSVWRYRGSTMDPTDIGRALNVEALLTGRISKGDRQWRLQLDLLDVVRAAQVWGAVYEGDTSKLVSLQTGALGDLAGALRGQLTEEESAALKRPLTDDPDAYDAYLRSRHGWDQRSEAGLRHGIKYLLQAIKADANFAAAHSALAHCYVSIGQAGYIAPAEAYPIGQRHASRALELDPSLAEARVLLGRVHLYYERDWTAAETEFQRGLAVEPNYAVGHEWYSVFLMAAGRPAEAFRALQDARRLDPLSLSIVATAGWIHYLSGQYDQAVKQLTFVLETNNAFRPAHLWLARTYLELGKFDEAMAEFEWVTDNSPGWGMAIAERGFAEGSTGRREAALASLGELEQLSASRFVSPFSFALIHAGLDDARAALTCLEKAFSERSNWLVYLRLDPRWNRLRPDPGFQDLVARMCFPDTNEPE